MIYRRKNIFLLSQLPYSFDLNRKDKLNYFTYDGEKMKNNKVKFILTLLSHNRKLIESVIIVNPKCVGKHSRVISR